MGQEDIVAQGEEMLNKLTRAELVALNRVIVRRIKVMDDFERFKANAAFYPGDKVSWKDKHGFLHRGWVTRVNTKTKEKKQINCLHIIVLLQKMFTGC